MFRGARIVLVEDDPIMGASIAQRLQLEGAEVAWVRQAVRAIHAIRTPRAPVHAVVCDIRLPDGSGEEVFTTLCRTMTPPPFLFITGQGGIEQAVRLLRAGAADYIVKPFEMRPFLDRLRLLVEPRGEEATPTTLGVSPAALRVEELARRAAGSSRTVLVHGPHGVGKAHVARRIHALSPEARAPLVAVNLARDEGLGDLLFGPDGALLRGGHGAVLLIALERMARPLQDRLCAALDAGFEGRILTTAGPDLGRVAAGGDFRADLLARLSALEIPVPPLRDRPDDAVWLMSELFARLAERRSGAPLKGLSSLAEEAARAHDWPGEGREARARLLQALERAEGPWIQPADLFPELMVEGRFPTLAEAREAAERRQIVAALERTGGHVSEAARLLRVSRTTLWEKMQKLGLS